MRSLVIVLFGVFWAGCGKTQAPVKPSSASPVVVAPVGSSQTQQTPPSTPAIDRFEGDVRRGQRFEKNIAPGMVFRLEPYAGNDSGWSIRLVPSSEPSPATIDCIGAVSEPMHGSSEVELEAPDGTSAEPELKRPREFIFVPTPSDCKVAWDLMNLVNYGSKLSDKERAEADRKLAQIPTSHGRFAVVDSRFGEPTSTNAHGPIEWLKFQVDLSVAAQAMPGQEKPEQTRSDTPEKSKGIRSVNVNEFLEKHLGELNPDLADLQTDCGEGQKPIQSLAPLLYGDLDGDGQEEAAVEGWSCLSGNGGADFFGVLKLMPSGKIAVLPIEPMPKAFKGRNPYEGLRGHLRLEIEDGRLVEVYPLYPDEKSCNSCSEGERRFVFRWDGHRFTLDEMIDTPPERVHN